MNQMAAVFLPLCMTTLVFAEVPQTINHQGVIKVNGTAFDGTGQFKFAILNALGVNVWTNDGTNLVLNGVPNSSENVTVVDGVYSVLLGGSGPGYAMSAIPAGVFNGPDRRLRIWFDDGANGLQQLVPDHVLASSPFAQRSAFDAPIGSIIAWHKSMTGVPALPAGWMECNGQVVGDAASPLNGQNLPDLNTATGYAGGRFLRGGMTSGAMQEATGVTGTGPNWNRYAWETGNTNNDMYLANQSIWAVRPTISVGPQIYPDGSIAFSRPVNMSVVWIMRVK